MKELLIKNGHVLTMGPLGTIENGQVVNDSVGGYVGGQIHG